MTTIVVIGTRLQPNGSGHLHFTMARFVGSPTNEQPGDGELIPNGEALAEALDKLVDSDTVIVNIDGRTIVIDGDDARGFFAQATATAITILAAIADGTIQSTIANLSSRAQTFVNDIVEDIEAAADEGRFIRLSNVYNLDEAADQFGYNTEEDDLAFTVSGFRPDSSDLDNDTNTTGYHQIFFEMDRINHAARPDSSTRIQRGARDFASLDVVIAHELAHISDSAADTIAELQALGISGSTSDDSIINPLAAEFISAFRRDDNFYDFDDPERTELLDRERVIGTNGYNNIVRGFTPDEALSIYAGGGNDRIETDAQPGMIQTGLGNDNVHLWEGEGFVGYFNEGGSDTLYIRGSTASNTTIERFGEWVYVGFQTDGSAANQNRSASETDSYVYWQIGDGPSEIKIGGTFYTEAQLLNIANSKPYPYFQGVMVRTADQPPGYFGVHDAWDPDGDTLSYSVVGVTGAGSNAQWSIGSSNALLWTNFQFVDRGEFEFTSIILRASDGEFYTDYLALIKWVPIGPPNSPLSEPSSASFAASSTSAFEMPGKSGALVAGMASDPSLGPEALTAQPQIA